MGNLVLLWFTKCNVSLHIGCFHYPGFKKGVQIFVLFCNLRTFMALLFKEFFHSLWLFKQVSDLCSHFVHAVGSRDHLSKYEWVILGQLMQWFGMLRFGRLIIVYDGFSFGLASIGGFASSEWRLCSSYGWSGILCLDSESKDHIFISTSEILCLLAKNKWQTGSKFRWPKITSVVESY